MGKGDRERWRREDEEADGVKGAKNVSEAEGEGGE